MVQLHYEVICRREVQLKIGILAIVFDQSLAMMQREGFQVMFMVFIGTNHYSLRLDIVAQNNAVCCGEISGCVKVFGEFISLVGNIGDLFFFILCKVIQ